ncbi:MAG: CPBP family intramembrane metalloprotease [Lachnospiraceae bacterium]|nr:CPBP family intramembrane metalloprotease [Lachnospiraceae bacterium]
MSETIDRAPDIEPAGGEKETAVKASCGQDSVPSVNDAGGDRPGVRRVTRMVCYGVLLYLFLFIGQQYLLYGEYGLAGMLGGSLIPEEPSEFMMGLMILISLTGSLILSWLYFSGKAEKGELFEDRSLFRSVFRTNAKMSPGGFFGCLALIYVMQIVFIYITELFEFLFNRIGYTLQYSEAMNADYNTSWTLLMYAVLIGPFAEEVVYRGYTMQGLKSNGRRFAIIASSLIFGLMHGDFQQSMFTFFAGLVFAYVAMRYSIWYSLALHVFNNGILSEFLIWAGGHMTEEAYIIMMLIVLIVSVIVVVRLIRTKGKDIRSWLRAEDNRPGCWKSLVNIWFVIFLVYTMAEIWLTIMPMGITDL